MIFKLDSCFILEVVAGEYDGRVLDQLKAYSAQMGHKSVKWIIVVMLDKGCLGRVRREMASRGLTLGDGLITALRSKDEKLQFENLLANGESTACHRNSTS